MARDHARIHLDIWGDEDWRELSPQAQHLYFVLYTWPPTLCGAGDWQPRKIQARARGWSPAQVLDAADELVAGDFLLIDIDTDEYLLRSWIKHDGLYRVQNMAVSVANARAALASKVLRGVVVHEVLKLRKAEPALESWKKDQVRNMLDQTAVDPGDVEWSSPWVSSSASIWISSSVSPKATPESNSSDSSRATPSPSPSPNSQSSTEGPRKRGARLPENWMPSEESISTMKAECPTVVLQAEHLKFVDYWTAKTGKDATKLDWDATWRNWIRRAAETRNSRSQAPQTGHDDKVKGFLAYGNNPENPPRLEIAQ
jgi:hypothetical protein